MSSISPSKIGRMGSEKICLSQIEFPANQLEGGGMKHSPVFSIEILPHLGHSNYFQIGENLRIW